MASLEPPEPGKKLEIKISHETNLGTYLKAGYDAQKRIGNLYQALRMAGKELARLIEHHDEYETGRSTGVLFHLPKDQQQVGRAAGMAFITAAAIQATRNVIEALVLPEAASLLDKPGHRSQTACDKLPRIWWIPIGAKPVSTMIDQGLHLMATIHLSRRFLIVIGTLWPVCLTLKK
ncbi:hypothetical protein J3459_006523 [Metarhizium acridum]|uniref:uncharacterized protein n=1 Tax=Metarhizium acridum TaxID=92637 RepID=UPI001C6BB8ED|nr:hypothetical protein J3458_005084 [Metarhizium acridum]KAG8427598.1 hypothetical protein J3459_006523 [Metarhizium acridum]